MSDERATETSHIDHLKQAQSVGPLGFAVITFSDTRTEATDKSGRLIRDSVEAVGYRVVRYAIVPDDPQKIRDELQRALDDPAVAVVITSGGTGVSQRDSAYEMVSSLLEKRLDGFGELFRMLSFDEIGAAAMLSRAVAGIARGKVLFALPGSSNAVRLGLEKLILSQAAHLYYELHKHREGPHAGSGDGG